jgi:hypothetical protein
VIDHNLALLPDFDARLFFEHHVFADQWDAVASDLEICAGYMARLSVALAAAQEACNTAPEEWLWENSEFDNPCTFDVGRALATLARCSTLELWRTE